jgi:N-acetyl-1-D-myo-inositol-2-amino-2-deoxy-alpha-D-glucopyranoside deacetylase
MPEIENQALTLLAVLAHPDDETFGMGGTLALYARRGVNVYLVCATRGEAGEVDANYLEGYRSIAERRVSELTCASHLLALKGVYFLDYRDSGMAGSPDNHHPDSLVAAPEMQVVEDVVHFIRTLKPQVVITFDPIGGYRHPDHIAIQRAAEKAFFAASDPLAFPDDLPAFSPQKLYFHTMPKTYLRMAIKLLPLLGKDPRKFGKNQDIDLTLIASENFPTHAVVNYSDVSEIRDEASACHASQGGDKMSKSLLGRILRIRSKKDTYMRAYPPPEHSLVENDLFEGVIR